MSSKTFLFVGLVITIVLFISSEVSARDLSETTEDNKKVDSEDVDQFGGYPGGGFGGYPGGGRGGFGGYPGGGRGGFGGYPGGGGYPGRGRYGCYYGCCRYYGRGCARCCRYPNEAVQAFADQARP